VTAGPGLDFTSALFLGMRHNHRSLPKWASLTTGMPAAWREPATARAIGSTIAATQGAQAGFVARSALHALTDAMTVLPRAGDILAIDEAVYPIAATASLIAKGREVTVRTYAHHRPAAPRLDGTGRVIYVTDGWCQGCNRPAPLPHLQKLAKRGNGIVVVDDSLACGILGKRRNAGSFGDGSGTPRWSGLQHDRLLWVASLAKGYGAPLAVVTGDADNIGRLARDGSRQHSSPPTAADLAAAAAALRDPRELECRRAFLHDHVTSVRRAFGLADLPVIGQPFPLVGITFASTAQALRWCDRLQRAGIHLLVQRPRCQRGALLTAVLRSEHSTSDIERLVNAMSQLANRTEAAS
jgi:8-amino-7-oxononanoate synthase